jgi:hypothetical protein
MELDVPMMEIGSAFGTKLEAARKTLNAEARALGARWLRGRIESSTVLRWNSVRARSLVQTGRVADYAIENSAKPMITAEELSRAIRKFGGPDGQGMIRMEECPF